MTIEAVKEKLYWYIEHADQSKVMAIYTLLNEDIETGISYDGATLDMLEKRRNDMLSGTVKTYTLEQTIQRIQEHRGKNGV